MDTISKLQNIAKNNGGIITTSKAIEAGISRATLWRLKTENKIQHIANGQYIFEDDIQDELLSIGLRSDKIIFSHETALYLHGISDRTPFEHTFTIPSGNVPPTATKSECKMYYIKPELHHLGRTLLKTPFGNEVNCYDLERTVCDIIRSRNKVGTETFLAALKAYAARPDKDLNRLYSYAKQLRVSGVLRKYLEVLL
ncbi:MAG: hypothetical protein IKU23_00720 [Clostridia bacterium]|nr:hypothetical protein [Clostridia bacterium]